jgi:DNA modification methylase
MKHLNINPTFRDLIQSLSPEEYQQLEQNVLAHGIRDAIVAWNDTIVDGHNRYQIAQKHDLQFRLHQMEFESESHAILWIIDNQMGRRNLTDFVKLELQQKRADVLYEQGRRIKSETAKEQVNRGNRHKKLEDLSIVDKTSRIEPAHNTREQIAETLNWGSGKVARGQYVIKHAPEEVKEQLRRDEVSINEAYKSIKKQIKADILQERKEREVKDAEEQIEVDKEFNVQQGQVWKLGRHTLICGDGHNFINHKIDAIITDPPYGIDYNPDWKKWDGSESDYSKIQGDTMQFDPRPFMNCNTVLFFGANYFTQHLPIGGWICWDKRCKDELDDMVGSPFELAWYRSESTNKSAIMIRVLHGGVVNADSQFGNNEKRYHPTQKPIVLMEEILKKITRPNDIICDPFCGSGSTVMASENTGRTCLAYEINATYCEMILSRFNKLTGIKPHLIDDLRN